MSKDYSFDEFSDVLSRRVDMDKLKCSICGNNRFISPPEYTALLSQKVYHNVSLSTTVPAGLLICNRCGHIEFFSLGVLGLLKDAKEEGTENAKEG